MANKDIITFDLLLLLFSLDEKSKQKNQGCAEILRFCLKSPTETGKTRPKPLTSLTALIMVVGSNSSPFLTVSDFAKSGFLQGRSHFALGRFDLCASWFVSEMHSKIPLYSKVIECQMIVKYFFSEPLTMYSMQIWNITRLIISTLFLVFAMPATHQAICISQNSPIHLEAQRQTNPENPEKGKKKIKRNYDNLILKAGFGLALLLGIAFGSTNLTLLLFTHPVTVPIGVAVVIFVALLYQKAYRSICRRVDRRWKREND